MKKEVCVVVADEKHAKYAEKLFELIRNSDGDVTVRLWHLVTYEVANERQDKSFKEKKLIFVGKNPVIESAISNISEWAFDEFGGKIGISGNVCLIFAHANNLPLKDYGGFVAHCKKLQIEHEDAIVPPDNFKKFLKKENASIADAQYCSLIYQFMDDFFENFIMLESSTVSNLKQERENVKEKATENLTKWQKLKCHAIIHLTAIGCAVTAFVPVPMADTIPITASQVSMVISLGKVFNRKISKADAKTILKTIASPLIGRTFAKAGLILIPGIGWVANGAIATIITETLGWSVVGDFSS